MPATTPYRLPIPIIEPPTPPLGCFLGIDVRVRLHLHTCPRSPTGLPLVQRSPLRLQQPTWMCTGRLLILSKGQLPPRGFRCPTRANHSAVFARGSTVLPGRYQPLR